MGQLSSWTLGIVVSNQIALAVVLAFAFGIGGEGPVSAYTYGWAFMQMPYAVVAVSVMAAITPELSRHWTHGRRDEYATRFGTGLRGTMGIILPASVGLAILAQPIVALFLYRGQGTGHLLTGTVLSVLALGLPGFTCFQYAIRGLQAMQRARDAFSLYIVENTCNVVLAITIGRHSIGVLTATVSISYTVAAVLALLVIRHRAGSLGAPGCYRPLARIALATCVLGVVTVLAAAATGWSTGIGLVVRLAWSVAAGSLAFFATAAWLNRKRAADHCSAWQALSGREERHGRRPHHHRLCVRPAARADRVARHHRGSAHHPLRRRGVHRRRRPVERRVLEAVQRLQAAARDRSPLARRLPGRL